VADDHFEERRNTSRIIFGLNGGKLDDDQIIFALMAESKTNWTVTKKKKTKVLH